MEQQTKSAELIAAERKTLETEYQLWTERASAVQARANAIQTETQLLQIQHRECVQNVERLRELLKPAAVNTDEPGGSGGGPGAPPPPPPPNPN